MKTFGHTAGTPAAENNMFYWGVNRRVIDRANQETDAGARECELSGRHPYGERQHHLKSSLPQAVRTLTGQVSDALRDRNRLPSLRGVHNDSIGKILKRAAARAVCVDS